MRIIAFISEVTSVQRILTHIGASPEPPPIASARGPTAWNGLADGVPLWDASAQPEPEYPFEQQAPW